MKHTIKNDYLVFESDSFNLEPWVLRFADEHVNYFWRPADLEKLGTAHCFPLTGVLPNNKYRYDGKEYIMSQHGFAQDREFVVAEKTEDSITYELRDDDSTYQQFPWHFIFQLKYSLDKDSLKTTYRVENKDSKKLYFSVGGHSRFSCPITEECNFEDYRIEFEKPEQIENIYKSYGPVSEIKKNLSEDGKSLVLGYNMFTEGCFCFNPYNSRSLCLKSDKSKRGLFVELGGAEFLQFWTKPDAPFIAIEPFYGATSSRPPKEIDGDWVNKPGIFHIEPGEIHTRTYTVRPLR
jgi:galactose mutarotase-like enzyme